MKNLPKSSGFTLIELLVVLSIISVLSIFSVANFNSFGEGQKTRGGAFDIQSLLKTAQANASSRVSCPLNSVNFGASWWVEVTAGNTSLPLKCQIVGPVVIKTYVLTSQSNNLSVSSVKCADGTSTNGTVSMKFASLNNQLTFSDSTGVGCIATTQYLNITLLNNKTHETKVIKMDKGGTISVQ